MSLTRGSQFIFLFVFALVLFPVGVIAEEEASRSTIDKEKGAFAGVGTIVKHDFDSKGQFEEWKTGPTEPDKVGLYDWGNREITWDWGEEVGQVRGNGGFLQWPEKLSAQRPIEIEFVAGHDNGNVHCGLFTGPPRFMAKDGGYYFNAGGCSNDFTSLARDGEWFSNEKMPFLKGTYPIRIVYKPDLVAGKAKITYLVNGDEAYRDEQPLPSNIQNGFTFAFFSGWTGGGYAIDQVSLKGTPLPEGEKLSLAQ